MMHGFCNRATVNPSNDTGLKRDETTTAVQPITPPGRDHRQPAGKGGADQPEC
jgi:hypothetical protein